MADHDAQPGSRDPRPAGPHATSPTCSTATRRRSTASTSPACARVLADDLWAQYGNADPVVGGDAVARLDRRGDRERRLAAPPAQRLPRRGRRRPRRARSSTTRRTRCSRTTPDTAKLLVGRYHNELRREHDGWRISRLVLEILWGEEKADAAGYLALIGGRGPQA